MREHSRADEYPNIGWTAGVATIDATVKHAIEILQP